MRLSSVVTVLLTALPILAQCHSWIECTDYQDNFQAPTSNAYNVNLCKGFMRGWNKFGSSVTGTFGANDCQHCRYQNGVLLAPVNMINSMQSDTCLHSKTAAGNYNSQFPSTVYTKNEKVRILWPGKNHGGPGDGTCVSNHPDPLDQIHVLCGSDTDLSISTMLTSTQYLAVDLQKTAQTNAYGPTTSTGLGFKNCRFQCADTDKALCYSDFIIPPNLPTGTCTFYWLWGFNPGEFYTTCWEAQVNDAPTSSGSTTPAPTTCSSVWQQCGGKEWTGSTCCATGTRCTYSNDWYSQCLPTSNFVQDDVSSPDLSSSPSETSDPDTQVASWIIAGTIAGLSIAALALFLVMQKRRQNLPQVVELKNASAPFLSE